MPLSNHPTIGFVTCAEYRKLTSDDLILAAALERRGAKVIPIVWSETPPQSFACDLLLLRSCWDYHLRPQAFASWITEAHRRATVINTPEIVRWNMDKHYLLDLQAAGFAVPETVVLEQGARVDLEAMMDSAGFTQAVIKPAISLSAYETYLVRGEEAQQFQDRVNALLHERAMLVQEFVPEIQTSGEWSLVFLGGEFSHAVSKLPKNGDFRVQHDYGGSHRLAPSPGKVLETASAILARFAPQALYCRADMVVRPQGPTLMELELIDPVLHFDLAPEAAEKMAERLCASSVER